MSDEKISNVGNELARYADELLNRAVSMCGSIADAADITQDVLLCALKYMQENSPPQNMQAWLYTVLKRRYYDHLRKKYRCPTVSLDIAEDISLPEEEFFGIEHSEEAEQIRRSLAHQTEMYRNVLVRFYMRGESVRQIAKALSIPENTVKSRLDSGRKKVRKEFEAMEKYNEASYSPRSMWISCSGSCGTNNEPLSLVAEDDLIAQNLLILAYNKPVTILELSVAVGIAAAYIEPIVNRLISGELMKRTGDKVYTDFVIFTPEDRLRTFDDGTGYLL